MNIMDLLILICCIVFFFIAIFLVRYDFTISYKTIIGKPEFRVTTIVSESDNQLKYLIQWRKFHLWWKSYYYESDGLRSWYNYYHDKDEAIKIANSLKNDYLEYITIKKNNKNKHYTI